MANSVVRYRRFYLDVTVCRQLVEKLHSVTDWSTFVRILLVDRALSDWMTSAILKTIIDFSPFILVQSLLIGQDGHIVRYLTNVIYLVTTDYFCLHLNHLLFVFKHRNKPI